MKILRLSAILFLLICSGVQAASQRLKCTVSSGSALLNHRQLVGETFFIKINNNARPTQSALSGFSFMYQTEEMTLIGSNPTGYMNPDQQYNNTFVSKSRSTVFNTVALSIWTPFSLYDQKAYSRRFNISLGSGEPGGMSYGQCSPN